MTSREKSPSSHSPLVTVYVTNHNYGKYVDECLESIYSQDFLDYEVIIIDDGSRDGPEEYLKKYESRENTTVILKEQEGLNITNNLALRLARGKYIIRVDADDRIAVNMLGLLVEKIESDPEICLVFPDYFLMDESGAVFAEEQRHDFDKVSLYDQPAHGACTLIRVETLEELNGYSVDFKCQDGYDLWIRIIERGKVANVSKPLFYYRQHDRSLTKDRKKILKTRADIIKKYADNLIPKGSRHVAILPVRSGIASEIAMRKIAGQRVIDRQINGLLDSEIISDIIVSSNHDELVQYLLHKDFGPNIIIDKRPDYLCRQHTPIESTAVYLCNKYLDQIDTVSIVSVEHVFRDPVYLDKGIRLLYLFKADCCIAVERMSDNLYKHQGSGLLPLSPNRSLRCEREFVYREVGGLHIGMSSHILKGRSFIEGRITHVDMDELSCIDVSSENMLHLAEYLSMDRSNG